MDRRIVFGNPLNDPGYQARIIDHYDKKYIESREDLEVKKKEIMRDMSNI